jgi:hypothetical protein
LAAAAIQFVGSFTTLFHARGEFPSITFYETQPYHGVAWFFSIFVLAVLGCAAWTRPSDVTSAAIVGYCAAALGGLTFTALAVVDRPASLPPVGLGYSLFMASYALEVVVVVCAYTALLRGPAVRAAMSVAVGPADLASVVIALSAAMFHVALRGQSLWLANGLPFEKGIVATAAMVTLGLVPLFAVRHERPVAAAMLLALAVFLAVRVGTDLLERFDAADFIHLTVGFWLTLVGLLLVVAAVIAAQTSARQPEAPLVTSPEPSP